jgi:hypothetical protein
MRFYLDTEFNGFGGPLISMALVSPDGAAFYEVQELLCQIDPWVQEHVYPVLNKEDVLPAEFRARFHAFITRFREPTIYCDWHADAAHFCNMLAGPDYGSSLDFACRIMILNTPPGAIVSANPHNALADARALMAWHEPMAVRG